MLNLHEITMNAFTLGFLSFLSFSSSLPVHAPAIYKYGISALPIDPRITPQRPDGRIVGGFEADPHSYPWQVALNIDETYFCGGTLISEQWVLTAAHCISGASSVVVTMGAHNITAPEATQQEQTTIEIIPHENYNGLLKRNDIGVLRLPVPVVFNEYIQSIGLTSSDPAANTTVVLTGWGLPSDNATTISEVLMEVEIEVMSDEKCQNFLGATMDYEQLICLAGGDREGSCSGDSGGPINYDEQEDGTFVVAGACSFGLRFGCELRFPSAYTSVFYFLDWIETQTGITP